MSGKPEREALYLFSPPALPHGGLFGVFLGVHAVGDALNLLHTGVGCKGKTQQQVVRHDLAKEAHARVGWTELSEADLIRDPAAALSQSAQDLQRRRKANVLLLSSSLGVDFTGADLDAAVASLAASVDVPVIRLPGVAAGDLWQGYQAVLKAMVELVDWSRSPDPEPRVGLVGHFFHRHEYDQLANLGELRRLTGLLGARSGPVFLSGEPSTALRTAYRCTHLVRLPYAGMSDVELAGRTRRSIHEAATLPFGLRATAAWLRLLGEALGLAPARVEKLISQEQSRLRPWLDLARRQLQGRRLAVVADTPLATGWLLLAEELGLTPQLVVLLDRSLGGEAALRRSVESVGGTLPSDLKIVTAPSLHQLRDLAGPAAAAAADPLAERPFDLVVRPDLSLAGTGWVDLPTVEAGFPANRKHVVYPLPELGYAGVAASAQRLLDAVGGVS